MDEVEDYTTTNSGGSSEEISGLLKTKEATQDMDEIISPLLVDKEEHVVHKHPSKKRRQCIFVAIALLILPLLLAVALCVGIVIGHYVIPAGSSVTTPCHNITSAICDNPPLLIISLDGFRYDYLDRGLTPNIINLTKSGVRAEFMKPAFPSKTFPNHFSIVTGLYPESHGIVDNYFFDRKLNASFIVGADDQNDPKWWLGEPVWVTASKQKVKTAVFFWPGSEVPIEGILPDIYFKYNMSIPFSKRVETVLSWFDLPDDQRPQFMASYFEEPDHSGHIYGPDSPQVDDAIMKVDSIIGAYISGLKTRNIEDCVNMVIVSDHGMTKIAPSNTVTLVPYILSDSDVSQLSYLDYGIFPQLFVKSENMEIIESLYSKLNGSKNSSLYTVYHRGEAPERFHISSYNQQRYGDLSVIANIGAYIKTNITTPPSIDPGEHGYDNDKPDMRAIFVAHGPRFKTGFSAPHFDNIEVYNLLCELLQIQPSPNNGTAGTLDDMLR